MAYLVPGCLIVIMFGMGLGLRLQDFRQILFFPVAALVGMTGQMVLLPLTALALVSVFPVRPEYAVGAMLLALCPGGALSNLYTYLARGDVALSVTLTSLSGLLTAFTIPPLINWSLIHFMGASTNISLPVGSTILGILLVTIIPVGLGMVVRHRSLAVASSLGRWVAVANLLFIVLILAGLLVQAGEQWMTTLGRVGVLTAALNLAAMLLGYVVGATCRLGRRREVTLVFEIGAQNALLGVTIAVSPFMLGNPEMALVPSTYALTSVCLLGAYTAWVRFVAPLDPVGDLPRTAR